MTLAQVEIREDYTKESCEADNGFCPSWIWDNFDRYVDPFWDHVYLTVVAVAVGFAISFALALIAYRRRWLIGPIVNITGILYTIPSLAAFFLLLPITGRGTTTALIAHRQRWLTGPIVGVTGVLYTIPSIAAFLLLLPLTGRGNTTAIIALVSYTLLIIFRNVTTGLNNVPDEMKDAGRGMGLTERQLLWRIELPLAVPEILAGLRIAVTTTVGLATLAFFAGAGGLGQEIYSDINFKSNVVTAGGLAVLLAAVLDVIILTAQRLLTPWRRAAGA